MDLCNHTAKCHFSGNSNSGYILKANENNCMVSSSKSQYRCKVETQYMGLLCMAEISNDHT